MSTTGMPIEEISRQVGHTSTVVTETVYRHELPRGRPASARADAPGSSVAAVRLQPCGLGPGQAVTGAEIHGGLGP